MSEVEGGGEGLYARRNVQVITINEFSGFGMTGLAY